MPRRVVDTIILFVTLALCGATVAHAEQDHRAWQHGIDLIRVGERLLLVWGIAEAGEKLFARRAGNFFATFVAIVILFFCAVQTRQQIVYWRNTQTLMEHALKLDPHNDVAAQILRIYRFEQEHPGVRENHRHDAR